MAKLSGIAQAANDLAQHLADNGVLAAVDEQKVNLPGVWVSVAGPISPELLDGNGTVTLWLYLISPDTVYWQALATLDELLGNVLDLVDPSGDITVQTVVMPDSGQELPALRLPMQVTYQRTETS